MPLYIIKSKDINILYFLFRSSLCCERYVEMISSYLIQLFFLSVPFKCVVCARLKHAEAYGPFSDQHFYDSKIFLTFFLSFRFTIPSSGEIRWKSGRRKKNKSWERKASNCWGLCDCDVMRDDASSDVGTVCDFPARPRAMREENYKNSAIMRVETLELLGELLPLFFFIVQFNPSFGSRSTEKRKIIIIAVIRNDVK